MLFRVRVDLLTYLQTVVLVTSETSHVGDVHVRWNTSGNSKKYRRLGGQLGGPLILINGVNWRYRHFQFSRLGP
jgi:hypothetical protein